MNPYRAALDSNQPIRSTLPNDGPIIFNVPTPNVLIAPPASPQVPTLGDAFFWTWPRNYRLTGLFFHNTSSNVVSDYQVADAGTLLSIIDDRGWSLCTDGFNLANTAQTSFMPALGLIGGITNLDGEYRPRWVVMDRIVMPGQRWRFQFANATAEDQILPALYFRVQQVEVPL